jgi:DMSO/TMAO reductase YedYZ molybdopterin-dependent catalytic subunit
VVVAIEDALADDVLLADTLDGRPLTGDHGAPVSPVAQRAGGEKRAKASGGRR